MDQMKINIRCCFDNIFALSYCKCVTMCLRMRRLNTIQSACLASTERRAIFIFVICAVPLVVNVGKNNKALYLI